MAKVVTATDIIERTGMLVYGDQLPPAFEARLWKVMQDVYSNLAVNDFLYLKSAALSLSVGSNTNTVDITTSDFGKPIKVYTTDSTNGIRTDIKLIGDEDWDKVVTSSVVTQPEYCRIMGVDTDLYPQLQITPQFTSATTVYVEYWKRPKELYEYTTGTATTVKDTTGVTGTSTEWNDFASAGDYFRIDANGKWYKIDSLTTLSTLSLTSVYLTSSQSSKAFTISNVIDLPEVGILCLVYGTAAEAFAMDGNLTMSQYYQQKYSLQVGLLKAYNNRSGVEKTMKNVYSDNRDFVAER